MTPQGYAERLGTIPKEVRVEAVSSLAPELNAALPLLVQCKELLGQRGQMQDDLATIEAEFRDAEVWDETDARALQQAREELQTFCAQLQRGVQTCVDESHKLIYMAVIMLNRGRFLHSDPAVRVRRRSAAFEAMTKQRHDSSIRALGAASHKLHMQVQSLHAQLQRATKHAVNAVEIQPTPPVYAQRPARRQVLYVSDEEDNDGLDGPDDGDGWV